MPGPTVAALAERAPGERRVALVPEVVEKLVARGHDVVVEAGAGAGAWHADDDYVAAGAKVTDADEALEVADVLLAVRRPEPAVLARLRAGQALLGLLDARADRAGLEALAARGVHVLSLDLLPRTLSRAQALDALTSQSSIAGYRAALVAAEAFGRFFPMMITAAGTARPATVLVLGAGVAGLAAIGTARRLGAQVTGYDVRPAAREEVTSLGAAFLATTVSAADDGGYARTLSDEESAAQRAELAAATRRFDVVIATAQVPGAAPPVLVTAETVDAMAPGSVVVDLAAGPWGGNVAGRVPDTRVVTAAGVTVIGAGNLPAQQGAPAASAVYARNVAALLATVVHDGALRLDPADEIRPASLVATAAGRGRAVGPGGGAVTAALLDDLALFVLALLVGFEVISRVPATLHTPMMSGANSIHGVVLVGAVLLVGAVDSPLGYALVFLAAAFAAMNVVGGYVVTDRMLGMFRARAPRLPDAAAPPVSHATVTGRPASGTRDERRRGGRPAGRPGRRRLLRARAAPHALPRHGAPRQPVSAAGMAAAVLATVVLVVPARPATRAVGTATGGVSPWAWGALGAGTLVGTVAGLASARRVEMTAMPQLVSLFNAVGGGAAAVVGVVEHAERSAAGTSRWRCRCPSCWTSSSAAVTFSGSLVAAGKLEGWVSGAPVTPPGSRALTVVTTVLALAAGRVARRRPRPRVAARGSRSSPRSRSACSWSCRSAAPTCPWSSRCSTPSPGSRSRWPGSSSASPVMIIAGALVGAGGTILTKLMADAMNRSVVAIMLGGFGTADASAAGAVVGGADVRRVDAEDVAIQLAYASSVIVVPGYGLAAAQAQREAASWARSSTARGVSVRYAIHPVAGRMPGHMNVLLAEANVPYAQLAEMDEVNPDFPTCDVALVVGANDVTNPAARRPGNPISGMPILDVDRARSVVVIKRSLGHGYAGLDNELYTAPQTGMLFADAKAGLAAVLAAVKATVA